MPTILDKIMPKLVQKILSSTKLGTSLVLERVVVSYDAVADAETPTTTQWTLSCSPPVEFNVDLPNGVVETRLKWVLVGLELKELNITPELKTDYIIYESVRRKIHSCVPYSSGEEYPAYEVVAVK